MPDRPYDWAEELALFTYEEEGMAVGDWPGWGCALLVIGAVAVLVAVVLAVTLAALHG